MPQSITPTMIAQEALMILTNEMVLGNLIYHGYSPEFQSGRGATVEVRVPTTFTASVFASTVAVQTAAEGTVSLVLDTLLDVTFELSSQELTHDVNSISEQYIKPAMIAHAQSVDSSIAALYADIAGNYAVTSSPAVSDIAGVRAVLNHQKAPLRDRRLVFHPTVEAEYISLDAFLNANKRADGGRAVREAELGRIMGFDTYMDQNMPTHTATTTEATALVNGALSAADTVMVFDNHAVAAGTANAGDVFWVKGGDDYMLSEGGTWSSNAGTVIFKPPLRNAVADNGVLQFYGGHQVSMAFHKNAFALVSAPLTPPISGIQAAVETYNGISCRVVFDYNSTSKQNHVSIDQLIGVKTLDLNLAARLMDGRNLT